MKGEKMTSHILNSANGLTLIRLTSTKPERKYGIWAEIKNVIKASFTKGAMCYVLMDHAACMGIYTGKELLLPRGLVVQEDFLRSLRVFDQKKELYIWRKNIREFYYRTRQDEECENGEDYAVDAHQLLWGTLKELTFDDLGYQWALFRESRGIEFFLPAEGLPRQSKRVALKTRNYIDYNSMGQAGYVDCRFIGIVGERGEAS